MSLAAHVHSISTHIEYILLYTQEPICLGKEPGLQVLPPNPTGSPIYMVSHNRNVSSASGSHTHTCLIHIWHHLICSHGCTVHTPARSLHNHVHLPDPHLTSFDLQPRLHWWYSSLLSTHLPNPHLPSPSNCRSSQTLLILPAVEHKHQSMHRQLD